MGAAQHEAGDNLIGIGELFEDLELQVGHRHPQTLLGADRGLGVHRFWAEGKVEQVLGRARLYHWRLAAVLNAWFPAGLRNSCLSTPGSASSRANRSGAKARQPLAGFLSPAAPDLP